ncbi:hypothetical protein B0A48_11833 [Cryoendolithus antarcticus]|uniref:UBA domain-containing protein n=1 Tax=Cryoendolithus antarcticus TaxID=1507870 RepID=A0A1V8ST95_9PEZI|nr:hypothetical protein B0A48_11833 [Cryoendolithus antarcticus]
MAEPMFASLNGAAMHITSNDVDVDFVPSPTNIARRSISIFSRRGTESVSESRPPFIAQAALQRMPSTTTVSPSMRQKKWLRRFSADARILSEPTRTPKGTILNAVPPAQTIRMSALEEEMATSPNEEILSALSAKEQNSMSAVSTLNGESGATRSPVMSPAASRSPSARKRESSRIGVWVNGVAHWDGEAFNQPSWVQQERIVEETTGFTPLRADDTTQQRPQLSVTIPELHKAVADMSLSTVTLPRSSRSFVSVAPASIVATYGMSTPQIIDEDVSPLDTASIQATPPPEPVTPNTTEQPEELHMQQANRLSSSTETSTDRDDDSVHSQSSSATSVEDAVTAILHAPEAKPDDPWSPSSTYSRSIGDGASRSAARNVDKPLPRTPPPRRMRPAPAPPTLVRSRGSMRSAPSRSPERQASLSVRNSAMKRSLSTSTTLRPATCTEQSHETSPTLSQAEQELHAQLSGIPTNTASSVIPSIQLTKSGSVHRSESVRSVMHPPARAPTLPTRSRKRDWRKSAGTGHIASQIVFPPLPTKSVGRRRSDSALKARRLEVERLGLRRSRSAAVMRADIIIEESAHVDAEQAIEMQAFEYDDGLCVVQGPVILRSGVDLVIEAAIMAESVLLRILASLPTLADLFSTATINKGMYRVFKENEMHLIKTVLRAESPAAWELREWTPAPSDESYDNASSASSDVAAEYTPRSYLAAHKASIQTAQTLASLLSPHALLATARLTQAIMRVSTFCIIFGPAKAREDDLTGQLDWLRGGRLARATDFSATVDAGGLDYDLSSILLNAPDHFGSGNGDSLGRDDLEDMLWVWEGLGRLMEGCSEVAMGLQIGAKDVGEWQHYVRSLGPLAVLGVATRAPSEAIAFALSQDWQTYPATLTSRSTFLRDPVARLLAEQHTYKSASTARDTSCKRTASLAAEIRLARQTSTKRRPSAPLQRTPSIRTPRTRQNFSLPSTRSGVHPAYRGLPTHVEEPAQPLPFYSPNSYGHHRTLSPLIHSRVVTYERESMTSSATFGGEAEDTADKAIERLMGMGFGVREVRDALRRTDMGDGLRVDRAIEVLIRNRGW